MDTPWLAASASLGRFHWDRVACSGGVVGCAYAVGGHPGCVRAVTNVRCGDRDGVRGDIRGIQLDGVFVQEDMVRWC